MPCAVTAHLLEKRRPVCVSYLTLTVKWRPCPVIIMQVMPSAETDPRDIAVKQVSCLAITMKVTPCTMAVTDPRDITIVRMV